MTLWFSAGTLAIVGIAVIFQRRPLAQMHALILGGTVRAGCIVAEGVVLLVAAVAILLFGSAVVD